LAIVTSPVEVPELILVLKLEFTFKLISAPVTVIPDSKVPRSFHVFWPFIDCASVVKTPPKVSLAGSKFKTLSVRVAPFALGELPIAASDPTEPVEPVIQIEPV
jgi:hypothetical protein